MEKIKSGQAWGTDYSYSDAARMMRLEAHRGPHKDTTQPLS